METKRREREESLEEIIQSVEQLNKKRLIEKQEALERAKKSSIQKQKDKEYEEYWKKREKRKEQNIRLNARNQDDIFRSYYMLRKNETLSDKVGKKPDDWNYNARPLSPRESAGVSSTLIGIKTIY